MLRYYAYIFVRGRRKNSKNARWDSWRLVRDSSPGPPEHKTAVLTTL